MSDDKDKQNERKKVVMREPRKRTYAQRCPCGGKNKKCPDCFGTGTMTDKR